MLENGSAKYFLSKLKNDGNMASAWQAQNIGQLPKIELSWSKILLNMIFFIPYELELRCMGKNHAKFEKKKFFKIPNLRHRSI